MVLPTDTCDTKCGMCCDTSCTVQHNVECEVACDISCSGTLQGTCTTLCGGTKGAIFCDGQFLASSNDPQACVDYLNSIGTPVDTSAWSITATLSGSSKGLSCAATDTTGATGTTAAALAGLALLSLIGLRRRSRSRK